MPGIQLQFADEKDYLTFLENVLQQGPKLLSEDGFTKLLAEIAKIGRYYGIKVEGNKVFTYEEPKVTKLKTPAKTPEVM